MVVLEKTNWEHYEQEEAVRTVVRNIQSKGQRNVATEITGRMLAIVMIRIVLTVAPVDKMTNLWLTNIISASIFLMKVIKIFSQRTPDFMLVKAAAEAQVNLEPIGQPAAVTNGQEKVWLWWRKVARNKDFSSSEY